MKRFVLGRRREKERNSREQRPQISAWCVTSLYSRFCFSVNWEDVSYHISLKSTFSVTICTLSLLYYSYFLKNILKL